MNRNQRWLAKQEPIWRWIGWTNANAVRHGQAALPRDSAWPVGPCNYCGGDQTGWDHIVPMARGGLHVISNLVPCCKPCNRRKHANAADSMAVPAVLDLLCGWCWKPIQRRRTNLHQSRYVVCPEHVNKLRRNPLPFGTRAFTRQTRSDGRKGYRVVERFEQQAMAL